ncbi:MAG: HlyU family transcriptional regulator [Beijerinckiaceae bacterium]
MSFLKRLFGGSTSAVPEAQPPSETHAGFTLRATPYQENGQWQMCGVIEKEVGGEMKSHRFVRADRFASKEEAEQFTLSKARQIVDQNGDRLFAGS